MRAHPGCAAFAAVLMALVVSAAEGQRTIGVKAGLSRASFSGSTLEPTEWVSGAAAGVFMTARLVDELSWQLEAMYVRKGSEVSVPGASTGSIALDYIEVPVMLRLDLPIAASAGLHLIGGPSAAWAARCSYRENRGPRSSCGDADLDVHALDAGMVAGAGLTLSLRSTLLLAEVRYGFGLLDIDAIEPGYARTNQAFTMLAGIAIPLARRPGTAGRR